MDDVETLIDDCENRESKLTDWERKFIDSLKLQVTLGRAPTPRQLEVLNAIWDRVT